MTNEVVSATSSLGENSAHVDALYQNLVLAVKENLSKVDINTAIFLVDVKAAKGHSLFTHYLREFEVEDRQQYNCHVCAEWLKQFGQQVTVNDGIATAIAFVPNPNFNEEVNARLAKLAKVVETSPIVSHKPDNNPNCEIASDEKFTHFNGKLAVANRGLIFEKHGQERVAVINVWREAHRVVSETLARYTPETVKTFSDLFEYGEFAHAREFRAQAKIFSTLFREYNASKHNVVKSNLVWESLGENFTTLLHFNGSSVGALIGYIAEGNLEIGLSEFRKYTASINHKRPTELPTEREIDLAQAVVEKEGLETAFERRFATVDDIQYWFWKAPVVEAKSAPAGGLFADMKAKDAKPKANVTPVKGGEISFMRFVAEILPKVRKLSLLFVPKERYNFVQLVAATHADSKPLLRWDKEDSRNTVSQYVYNGGSTTSNWLPGNVHSADVVGITTQADMWANPELKFGVPAINALFVLKGAKDSSNNTCAIFPEDVNPKYRDLRRVIERYSNTHKLDEVEAGDVAAGLIITNAGKSINAISGPFGVLVEIDDDTSVVYEFSNYM